MTTQGTWYIVKQADGHCKISSDEELSLDRSATETPKNTEEIWGPFTSRHDAIARRVGLIRAGKCQPAQ
jgi:hypothetical protein